ncbi:MAG: hypothetical protein GXX91_02525 [Verrucomicrobiaceae bacterium]|nr:hypothetical protein [Verrucomicrobiaceae bacterium]
MHRFLLTFGTSLILVAGPPLLAETSPRKTIPMRDSTTHETLSQSLRMAQQKDPIRDLGPAAGDVENDPSKRNSERDLIKDSAILCYQGLLTLVPKRAVLHLPEELKDRFEVKPDITVKPWAEFYALNRGWIRTIEVTRAQAMGEEPMSEETVEAYRKSKAAIIATYQGGPISVLPLKVPEEEGENPDATGDSAATLSSSVTPANLRP